MGRKKEKQDRPEWGHYLRTSRNFKPQGLKGTANQNFVGTGNRNSASCTPNQHRDWAMLSGKWIKPLGFYSGPLPVSHGSFDLPLNKLLALTLHCPWTEFLTFMRQKIRLWIGKPLPLSQKELWLSQYFRPWSHNKIPVESQYKCLSFCLCQFEGPGKSNESCLLDRSSWW
jgi:hypothetical protein